MKKKMVSEQNMTQIIMQEANETTKAALMVIRETENHVENLRTAQLTPSACEPVSKQPTFD